MKKNIFITAAAVSYLIAAAALFLIPVIYLSIQLRSFELLCMILLLCTALYAGGFFLGMANGRKQKIMHYTFAVIFVIYIIFLLFLTLWFQRNRSFDFNAETYRIYFTQRCNIIPFKTISGYICGFFTGDASFHAIVVNILGNLAAFAPFSLFLPLFFPQMKKMPVFAAALAGIVLLIELLQLLTLTGSFDVDDIILNTAGACVMLAILKIKPFKKQLDKLTMQSE